MVSSINNVKRPVMLTGATYGKVKVYESVVRCASRLGVAVSTVYRHIKNGEPINGYILQYADEED